MRLASIRPVFATVLVLSALLAPVTVAGAETPDFASNVYGCAPLPASPIKASVDAATDMDDVFSVQLDAGDWIYVSSKGAGNLDHDLFLFPPGTASVIAASPAVYASEGQGTASERVLYQAPTSGTYYLDVYAFAGYGDYSLQYGFPSEPASITVTAPATTPWNSSARVTGQVKRQNGSVAGREQVILYAKPDGAAAFTRIAYATADEYGTYAFSPKPTKRTTYRVRHAGSANLLPAASRDFVISPKAYLTSPSAPSTVRRWVAYTTTGYLKPRHSAGAKNVRIVCYRYESQKWVARKSLYATNTNYSSYTKYSARLSLPAGRWKITASVTGDSQHAATISAPRYRTVR